MSLESAVTGLGRALTRLQAMLALVRAAADDHPEPGEAVFVELYGDAADDLTGRVQEGLEAAWTLAGAGEAGDLRAAGRGLSAISGVLASVRERLYFDLIYPRLAELDSMGTERGGEWAGWCEALRQAVEACVEPLMACEGARDQAWCELGARAAGGQLLVRAVGAPRPRDAWTPREEQEHGQL